MMRYLLVIGFAFVASATASYVQVGSAFGYHQRVGVVEAERIKQAEDLISENDRNRIVGGIVSQVNAHPHLGGLVINLVGISGLSVCGSSLLTANRLVTAAHCWFDGNWQAWQFTVVLGSQFLFSGGTRIPTTQVFMHPEWTPSLIANDVAMIHLPESVIYSMAIQPISLPEGNEIFDSFVGEMGTAAGYGVTSDQQQSVSPSTVVSEVQLRVISVPECQATFGHFARDSNICTSGFGGVGICGGDSGGPLIIFRAGRYILVGVSSFVAAIGCELGHPSSFARITSFQSFITQHL